jgi:hypothetical protein
MTTQTLINDFRLDADDLASPPLWSDAYLTRVLNEAQTEAARRSRLLVDATTTAICQIPVTGGTAPISTYDIDGRVIFLLRVKLGSQIQPLRKMSVRDMDERYPDWENAQPDTPIFWIPDIEDHKVRIWPTPVDDDTLNLQVVREPLAPMSLASTGTQQPIAGITLSGSTATVVLVNPDPNLFDQGNVTISGADQTEYNGAVTITLIDSSTFTYTVSGAPASPATGSLQYQQNILAVDPEIEPRYQLKLNDWAFWRALNQRDKEERYDPDGAKFHLAEFEAEFGPRSSAQNEKWIHRRHGYDSYEGLY